MKKHLLGIIAVVAAVSLSAFTTTKTTQSLWYKDGSNFMPYTGQACPTDVQIQCEKEIPGLGVRPIFTAPDDDSPLLTRP